MAARYHQRLVTGIGMAARRWRRHQRNVTSVAADAYIGIMRARGGIIVARQNQCSVTSRAAWHRNVAASAATSAAYRRIAPHALLASLL